MKLPIGLPLPENDTQETLLALIVSQSLTSIDLRRITRSSYPPARIRNVRDLGIDIYTSYEPYINRRGEKSSIARYHLATPLVTAKKIYKQLVKG